MNPSLSHGSQLLSSPSFPKHHLTQTETAPQASAISHAQTPANATSPALNTTPHWKTSWFWNQAQGLSFIAAALLLSSCQAHSTAQTIRLNLHQQWQLQPGATIANTRVHSGLGDLVLELNGQALYMPKAGRVEALAIANASTADSPSCVAVSSPEIPAYKLRLCQLEQLQLGQHPQGAVIGKGEQVAIAMLRKQPEGTWAFVEPAPSLLEALLHQP